MQRIIYYLVLLLLVNKSFAHARDLGDTKVTGSSSCFFEASYMPSKNYDIKPNISYLKLKMVGPFLLQVTMRVKNLAAGNFVGISFYDPNDPKHPPLEDLSKSGTDEEIEASSFVQLKAMSTDNTLSLAPVVYKKGYRGTKNKKDMFANPFAQRDSIYAIQNGSILGGEESFFTDLVIRFAGKGAYRAYNTGKAVLPNKDNNYIFFIKLNPNFVKKMFFISSITKISILPSGRGLRSDIKSNILDLTKGCK